MSLVVFILIYPIVWLLSLLPLRLLYVFSDILFVIVYHIFGYRKSVVLNNLKLAFPEKDVTELKKIRKRFFRHFTDMMVEGLKSLTISKKDIQKRYQVSNPELINSLLSEGKSVILLASHYGNWEWTIGLPTAFNETLFGSYTYIKNPYFDRTVKNMREKFGMSCIKSEWMIKNMILNQKEKKQGVYLLISDQSPHVGKINYWSEFFNIPVPVANGAELMAKKFDMAVVNMNTSKTKRGYYSSEFSLISDSSKEQEKVQITEVYLQLIQEHIRNKPEYYLWSHKRFKHMDKVPKNFAKKN